MQRQRRKLRAVPLIAPPQTTDMTDESRRHIEAVLQVYQQDCENVRYQDALRWSRFQTVAAIEGGALYAVLGADLGRPLTLWILLASLLLIVLLAMLAKKDQNDMRAHIDRLRRLENELEVRNLVPGPAVLGLRGGDMMSIAIAVLLVGHILLTSTVAAGWVALPSPPSSAKRAPADKPETAPTANGVSKEAPRQP
jgi:hypothetical protein